MFKFAAQNKLRFPSNRGELSTENLFDLPLKSASGFDLNSIAQWINKELKATGEESFVEDITADPRRKALEVSLEIVKDVIKTKQEENALRLNKVMRAEERRRILDAMSAKQDQALSAASLEELQKKLDALDA
jgi:hypothetical protein